LIFSFPLTFLAIVSQIAEKLGKTPAQVVLRWGIQRGTSVLPKSTNFDRLRSNLEVTDWALSEEDMKALSSIDDQVKSLSLSVLSRVSCSRFDLCGKFVGRQTWPLAVF
jgi:diketogulonate reductase-like aldo/keto reductase